MATIKKITKRDNFNALLAIPAVTENAQLVSFIEHEIELLDKKNSADKKPTAQQIANKGVMETIMQVLSENGGLMTVTDVQKSNAALAELSNQRISALLRQLKDERKVERVEDKRKAFFKIAE